MADADLRVLTVVRPGIGADASAGPARDAAERNRAALEATVADAIAELTPGVRAESEVLVDDPATALASVSPNLDLLVMGSRGYGPGLAVLLGGVSRRVTMTARCPVLVVPRGSTSALAAWGDRAAAYKTYSSKAVARRAVRALTAAGVPRRDILLLTGRRLHDIRREAVGGFAGAVDPSASVGTYAGAPWLRRQAPRRLCRRSRPAATGVLRRRRRRRDRRLRRRRRSLAARRSPRPATASVARRARRRRRRPRDRRAPPGSRRRARRRRGDRRERGPGTARGSGPRGLRRGDANTFDARRVAPKSFSYACWEKSRRD